MSPATRLGPSWGASRLALPLVFVAVQLRLSGVLGARGVATAAASPPPPASCNDEVWVYLVACSGSERCWIGAEHGTARCRSCTQAHAACVAQALSSPDRPSSILPQPSSPATLRFLLADGLLGPAPSSACSFAADAVGWPAAASSASSEKFRGQPSRASPSRTWIPRSPASPSTSSSSSSSTSSSSSPLSSSSLSSPNSCGTRPPTRQSVCKPQSTRKAPKDQGHAALLEQSDVGPPLLHRCRPLHLHLHWPHILRSGAPCPWLFGAPPPRHLQSK